MAIGDYHDSITKGSESNKILVVKFKLVWIIISHEQSGMLTGPKIALAIWYNIYI